MGKTPSSTLLVGVKSPEAGEIVKVDGEIRKASVIVTTEFEAGEVTVSESLTKLLFVLQLMVLTSRSSRSPNRWDSC